METEFGLLEMIQQGYYATYPLLLMSVVCLAIIFERLWALKGIVSGAGKAAEALIDPLRQGRFEQAIEQTRAGRTSFERIYYAVVRAARVLDRDKLLELEEKRRFEENLGLKGGMWVLATSGASAPFIGLLGTVVGILLAFRAMAIQGSGGFSVVAAGISQALISTTIGLAVAILAVIFYNYFSVKIEKINAVIKVNASLLIDAALEARQAPDERQSDNLY